MGDKILVKNKKTSWFLMPFSGIDMIISFILPQEKFSCSVLSVN